jgi:16S rRNA (cytosine967-C5)-methyltransferase
MALTPHQFRGIVDALTKVMLFAYPAEGVLASFFREHPKLGSGDRKIISETIYATLRHYYFLCAVIAPEDPTPKRLAIAALLRRRGHDIEEVSAHLSDQEKAFAAALIDNDPTLDVAARAELPAWLVEKLGWSEDEVVKLGQGFLQPAPLDLRVNTVKARRKKILAQLTAEGIEAMETPYSPIGIRLKEKSPLQKHPLFVNGEVEVQDEGSQLLGLLVGAKRGEMVVDFCAGAGGKTLLLAAAMANTGRVYAFDIAEKRLDSLTPRLKRSGLTNVSTMVISSESDSRIQRLNGKIDRVLVDAPCTGLGTLRRHPDLKFRQSPQSVAAINIKQSAILESAAQMLKRGGRLVYATCSILADENERIVEAFLAKHPSFQLVPIAEVLPKIALELDSENYLHLYPHRHSTDGFFAAVMVRKA